MTVAATIDFAAVTDKTWDVLVVGAGPAGAMAARETARLGASVLLVDKAEFPRSKVCGCSLNRRSLALLDDVGLGELPERYGGVPLHRFHLAVNSRHAIVPLPGGVSLSRQTLDAGLVDEAIAAGVEFLPGVVGRLGDVERRSRSVALQMGRHELTASARVVLAADGLGSRLLSGEGRKHEVAGNSRIGCSVIVESYPPFYDCGTIFMACGKGGYVGLVRLESGCLDVAAAFDPQFVKRAGGLGSAATTILAEAGFPRIPNLAGPSWRGTPLLTRRALRPAAERVLAIGDAAGYIEPFTGEGIFWALASGKAVGPLARRAVQTWDDDIAARWSMLYHHKIARRQRVCRVVAEVLRHPRLTGWLVAGVARLPALATPLVQYLNFTPPARKGIVNHEHGNCRAWNGPAP
jgi:flavin-dependent dehydrogenase